MRTGDHRCAQRIIDTHRCRVARVQGVHVHGVRVHARALCRLFACACRACAPCMRASLPVPSGTKMVALTCTATAEARREVRRSLWGGVNVNVVLDCNRCRAGPEPTAAMASDTYDWFGTPATAANTAANVTSSKDARCTSST